MKQSFDNLNMNGNNNICGNNYLQFNSLGNITIRENINGFNYSFYVNTFGNLSPATVTKTDFTIISDEIDYYDTLTTNWPIDQSIRNETSDFERTTNIILLKQLINITFIIIIKYTTTIKININHLLYHYWKQIVLDYNYNQNENNDHSTHKDSITILYF